MTTPLDNTFSNIADTLMGIGGKSMVLRQETVVYDDSTGGTSIVSSTDTPIKAARGNYSDLMIANGLVQQSDLRLYVRSQTKPQEGDTIFLTTDTSGQYGRVAMDPKPLYAVDDVILWDVQVTLGET